MIDKSVNVFVLNWNGEAIILDCLRSLDKVTYVNTNIILIDNGSTDRSVDIIKKEFPNIEIIMVNKNLGYAGGNNYGLNHSNLNIDQVKDIFLYLNSFENFYVEIFVGRKSPCE